MIRVAGVQDFPLIARAQAACRYENDAVSDEEISAALHAGAIEGYVLERPGVVVFLAVTVSQGGAMLSCFYREGSPIGLRGDSRKLLDFVREKLGERGVTRLFLCLSDSNPKMLALYRFYVSLGFGRDMIRMGRGI